MELNSSDNRGQWTLIRYMLARYLDFDCIAEFIHPLLSFPKRSSEYFNIYTMSPLGMQTFPFRNGNGNGPPFRFRFSIWGNGGLSFRFRFHMETKRERNGKETETKRYGNGNGQILYIEG